MQRGQCKACVHKARAARQACRVAAQAQGRHKAGLVRQAPAASPARPAAPARAAEGAGTSAVHGMARMVIGNSIDGPNEKQLERGTPLAENDAARRSHGGQQAAARGRPQRLQCLQGVCACRGCSSGGADCELDVNACPSEKQARECGGVQPALPPPVARAAREVPRRAWLSSPAAAVGAVAGRRRLLSRLQRRRGEGAGACSRRHASPGALRYGRVGGGEACRGHRSGNRTE